MCHRQSWIFTPVHTACAGAISPKSLSVCMKDGRRPASRRVLNQS
jgi:hypothetical protein